MLNAYTVIVFLLLPPILTLLLSGFLTWVGEIKKGSTKQLFAVACVPVSGWLVILCLLVMYIVIITNLVVELLWYIFRKLI